MTKTESTTVRLKVAPEVARVVKPGAPRELQLAAARGALPLDGRDLLTVLFFLSSSKDAEIKRAAVQNVREAPAAMLLRVLMDAALPAPLLELLVRARLSDVELMKAIIRHPAATHRILHFLAGKASTAVLEELSLYLADSSSGYPEMIEAIVANPAAGNALKCRLGWRPPELPNSVAPGQVAADDTVDMNDGRSQTELEALVEQADRQGLSKYQIALELKVVEKIKLGLTGDKEWRSILLKEANKLVQGAVMKNPRISDGEVLMVAKSKTSSDEMIRIILLNKDWIKNYEIRKALVTHPKTPLPKALRFVSGLSTKDIKNLARSRQVSNVIATAARKELEMRLKKTGG